MESTGVYIAFKPIESVEEQISRLEVILVNSTPRSLLFTYEFLLNEVVNAKVKNRISASSAFPLHEISAEQMNDFPAANLEFWREQSEEGKQHHFQKTIKIKAQSFFTKLQHTPVLNESTYLFFVFEDFPEIEKKSTSDADNFVQSLSKKKSPPSHEVIRHASFETEIDLHAEKLIPHYKGMSNAEIIKIQLSRFRQFLERAIANGVPKIYAIHGVGKGKLREEIHHMLREYPEVQSFNNDYHVRYGFGATEIFISAE